MKLTGRTVAAARELLSWSQQDLAEASGVSKRTIARFELGEAIAEMNIEKIKQACELRGIVFLNGDSPGARLDFTKQLIMP